MVTNYDMSVEVFAKKGENVDLRCTNCGKKLCEIEKSQVGTGKKDHYFLSIKCDRCKKINVYSIK